MPFLSFVIPVYNVENYLKQCLDSILHQNYQNYEIILVDDGSTDNSGEVCDAYGKLNARVKVFHKSNGGLSDARNFGLKKATGQYVLFVDSDDYIAENSIQDIARSIAEQNNPDIMFLEVKKVFADGKLKNYDVPFDISSLQGSKEEVLTYISSRNMYPASAWSKAVKIKILEDNGIEFIKGQLSEDYEWTLALFLYAKTFGYCSRHYYYYRQNRQGSIVNTFSEKHFVTVLEIVERWCRLVDDGIYPEYISNSILKFAAYLYYRVVLWKAYPFYKKYKERIDDKKELIRINKSRDAKIIHFFYELFGVHIVIVLLHIYAGLRKN